MLRRSAATVMLVSALLAAPLLAICLRQLLGGDVVQRLRYDAASATYTQ